MDWESRPIFNLGLIRLRQARCKIKASNLKPIPVSSGPSLPSAVTADEAAEQDGQHDEGEEEHDDEVGQPRRPRNPEQDFGEGAV